MSTAPILTKEAQAFIDACDVRNNAVAEWLEAMNGPLPGVKVDRVQVPRVMGELRRPAPEEIPATWSLA